VLVPRSVGRLRRSRRRALRALDAGPRLPGGGGGRLALTYPLLSDEHLAFASALGLPTFEVEGTVLLRRLTMVLRDGRVDRVLYPVFPPDRAAADALAALQA